MAPEVVGAVPLRAGVVADVAGEESAESEDAPRPADGASAAGASLAVPAWLPLRVPRDGEVARVDGPDVEAPADGASAFEPVDPPEPVVSAKATGTDGTAKPTPSATASAPTRPT